MAFIYNKKTKVTTECRNEDVIATLKKDAEYIVTDRLSMEDDKSCDLSKLKLAALKELAIDKGITIPEKATKAQLIALLS